MDIKQEMQKWNREKKDQNLQSAEMGKNSESNWIYSVKKNLEKDQPKITINAELSEKTLTNIKKDKVF